MLNGQPPATHNFAASTSLLHLPTTDLVTLCLSTAAVQAFKEKITLLAEAGLSLAEGLFALMARMSLPENMTSCIGMVSVIVELLDEQAAPLIQPIASTADRVS